MKSKSTSSRIAALASEILKDDSCPENVKAVAASALAQAGKKVSEEEEK